MPRPAEPGADRADPARRLARTPMRSRTRAASAGTNGSSSVPITRTAPTSGARTARAASTITVAQQRPRARRLDVTIRGVDQPDERAGRVTYVEPGERGVDPRRGSRRTSSVSPHAGAGSTGSSPNALAASVTVRCTRLPTPFARSRFDGLDEAILGEVGLADARHLAAEPPAQRVDAVARRSAPTGSTALPSDLPILRPSAVT